MFGDDSLAEDKCPTRDSNLLENIPDPHVFLGMTQESESDKELIASPKLPSESRTTSTEKIKKETLADLDTRYIEMLRPQSLLTVQAPSNCISVVHDVSVFDDVHQIRLRPSECHVQSRMPVCANALRSNSVFFLFIYFLLLCCKCPSC